MAYTKIGVTPEETARRKALEKQNYIKRRARLMAARLRGRHTDQEWLELVSKHTHCPRCKQATTVFQKDHIIPIYQGGSDGIENIQPLCKTCNAAKGPETIDWRTI